MSLDPPNPTPPGAEQPVRLLEAVVEPVVNDMGFDLLLLEWLGSGKRRVLRVYLDHPEGVTVGDCSRMSQIIGNALDAAEAAAKAGAGEPVLAALLDRAYTLEVSSPGVDRPLARRSHFEAQIGQRIKLKTEAPLTEGSDEKSFDGRLLAVEDDPERSDDPRAALIVLADRERDRTLRIPLARIRRANLVWEG